MVMWKEVSAASRQQSPNELLEPQDSLWGEEEKQALVPQEEENGKTRAVSRPSQNG